MRSQLTKNFESISQTAEMLAQKIEEPQFYSLDDIAQWQLNENSNVSLPPLQRGFVWKVSQIETLWDSVLRGFPIGSFLLAKNEDENLFLLDGQQRATAISLGFNNAWAGNPQGKFWSLESNKPIIWIDLAPSEKTNTQSFVLRVVTQSHPWGYQRKNNKEKLSVGDRRKAIEKFQNNDKNKDLGYTKFQLTEVFPYDCDLPVPLAFLIDAVRTEPENWKQHLIDACKKLKYTIQTKGKPELNYIEELTNLKLHEVDVLIQAIKNLDKIKIPGIQIERKILLEDQEQEDDNSESGREDPTLFVRLNSSGTRIEGEELIYSIYKAYFPQTKQLVERIGKDYIAPSRVISLISRLALSDISNGNYPPRMNVRDFQKHVNNPEFRKKLIEYIGTNEDNSPSKKIFNKAIEILLSKATISLPPVLVMKIINNSPEIFLMLLKWLNMNHNLDHKVERKIIASVTSLSWFCKDGQKYLKEIWKDINADNFWSKSVLGEKPFGKGNYSMCPLIHPETIKSLLTNQVIKENTDWYNLDPNKNIKVKELYCSILVKNIGEEQREIYKNEMWANFIKKLMYTRELVFFAQRNFINKDFPDYNDMHILDDTNAPWDWDHVYPSSWIYKKKNIDPRMKFWNNTIGNLRAISLEQNREESDYNSPKGRLGDQTMREVSFVQENDWEYWKKIDERINSGEVEVSVHLNAVINRLINIYSEWFNELKVGDLFDFGE